jgi:murein DD-endopeptidase MepM/ murein hydrolase activator NlpD
MRGAERQVQLGLAIALAALVGVNVYVFLIRPGNIRDLKKKVAAGRIAQGQALGPDGIPLAPGAGGGRAPEAPAAAPAPNAPSDGAPAAGKTVEGRVLKGDTLAKILARVGLEPPEQGEVLRALDGVLDAKAIRADQGYLAHFDDDGRLDRFEFRVSPATLVVVTRGADGKLVARKAQAKTEIQVHEVRGTITSSLYEAVKSQGESTELVADLADLFAGDLNFYLDTHEGDRFAIVVEKQYLDGEFYQYGKILAAEYAGRAGTYQAYFWNGAYFDENGQSLTRSMLKTPLKFARVSSGFNPKRMHPVLHRVKGHFGTDFAAPVGTPVWAAADATVVSVGPAGGAGNLVVLDHGGGLKTYYMHLLRFAKGLQPGQRVKQKQVIGYVGATGLATGPHLHLGVQQGGAWVDWNKLKPRRAAPVPRAQLAAFRAAIAPEQATLARVLTPDASSVAQAAPPARAE